MKIYWASRHQPLESQSKELNRLFGECEIIIDTNSFCSAAEIVNRFRKSKANELVIVAPLTYAMHILSLGIKPLWAEMESVNPYSLDVEVKGSGRRDQLGARPRAYKFLKFKRLVKIDVTYEDLK